LWLSSDAKPRPDTDAASTPTLCTHTHTHTGITVSKLKNQIWDAAEAIDTVFGEGYCKKNPELLGRVLQSEALTESAQEVVHALHKISAPPTLQPQLRPKNPYQ
jgi:hypothetical protein